MIDGSYRFVDLNSDGQTDLFRADSVITYSASGRQAWLHDPGAASSAWIEDDRFLQVSVMWFNKQTSVPGANPVYDAGGRLVDINQDGMVDFVRAGSGVKDTWLSKMTFPDLIVQHANGSGGQVDLTYASDVEQRDAALDALAATDEDVLDEEVFDILRWRGAPVVSTITTSGIDVPTATQSFAYSHPKWCPNFRTSLGYRIHEATNDQDTSLSHMRFWQRHGRAGRRSLSEVYESGVLLRSSSATWDVLDGSTVTGSLPGVHVGRLDGQATQSFGPAAEAGALHEVTYTYDDTYGYNFIDTVTIDRPTGGMTIDRDPVTPADTVNWVLGLVDEEEWTDPGGVVLRRERFDYLAGTGLATQVERDVLLREASASLENTAVTTYTYDAYGNLTSRTDPEERVRSFCYDGDVGGAAACPLPPSGSTVATHSVPTAVVDEIGGISSFDASLATGEIEAVLRYNGDQSWIVPDAFGRPVELWVQPEEHTEGTLIETVVHHDGVGGPSAQPSRERFREVGDATSIREALYADGFGREVRSVYPTPDGWAGRLTFRDFRGRPVTVTPDSDCGADSHCDVTPPAGVSTTVTYDALNRVTSVDSPADGLALREYSGGSRTSPIDSVPRDYDLVRTTLEDGRVTQHLVDGKRFAFIEECGIPGGGGCAAPETTFLEYLPTGETAKIWNALEDYTTANNRLAYLYDTLGRVREIDDPDGGTTTQEYDLVGNLSQLTNGRLDTTTYTYDALDRLETIDRPGTEPTVTVNYDNHTRRKSLTFVGTDVITGHNYDDFGRERRKTVVTQGVTLITDFEYDLLGRVKRVQYPDYTALEYTYEGAYLKSLCTAVAGCGANTTWISDITYDGIGRESEIVESHGVRGFEYDPATYQLERKTFQETTSSEYWLDLNFTYDTSGRMSAVSDLHEGVGTDGIDASGSYTYDDHCRLESWTWTGDPGGASTKWFQYDVLGNLTGRSLPTSGATPNQVYGDPTRPHAITSRTGPSKTYAYDGDGNMTERGGQHLKYDSANHLVCVGSSAGLCDIAQFGYDASGVRAYELAGGETRLFVEDLFVWNSSDNEAVVHVFANGGQIGQQVRSGGSLRTSWLPPSWDLPFHPEDVLWAALASGFVVLLVLAIRSGTVTAIARRPLASTGVLLAAVSILVPDPAMAGGGNGTVTKQWTYHDHLGTRVLLVSDTPEVIYRRVYEPFGEVVAESTGTESHTRYLTGKRESEATRDGGASGLIDFGARWYDPETGRFTGIDPIVQTPSNPASHNPYSYVWNDPVNLTDPTGAGVLEKTLGVLYIIIGVLQILTQQYGTGIATILQGASVLAANEGQTNLAIGLAVASAFVGTFYGSGGVGSSSVFTTKTSPPINGLQGESAPAPRPQPQAPASDGVVTMLFKAIADVWSEPDEYTAEDEMRGRPESSNVGDLSVYVAELGFWTGLRNWAGAKAYEDESSRHHIEDREPTPNSNYRILEAIAERPAMTAATAIATGGVATQPTKALVRRAANSATLREIPYNAAKGWNDVGKAYAPAGYTRGGHIAYGMGQFVGTALRVGSQ